MTNFPNFFNAGGVRYNSAGQGRQPYSRSYVCVQTGVLIEVFAATVVTSGPQYALARVSNAPAMGAIRVDAASMPGFQALIPGQPVLVAALQYTPDGARATIAIPVRAAVPALETGVIVSLQAPTWGWISRDSDGARIFLHASNLAGFPRAGQRVVFQSQNGPKGLYAVNVHPATNQPQSRAQWR